MVAGVDAFHAIDYSVVGPQAANTWKFYIQITPSITSVLFVRKGSKVKDFFETTLVANTKFEAKILFRIMEDKFTKNIIYC